MLANPRGISQSMTNRNICKTNGEASIRVFVLQRHLERSAIGDGWRALYLHMPMSKREKPILTWHGPNLDTPIPICREPSQLSRNRAPCRRQPTKQYINIIYHNQAVTGIGIGNVNGCWNRPQCLKVPRAVATRGWHIQCKYHNTRNKLKLDFPDKYL